MPNEIDVLIKAKDEATQTIESVGASIDEAFKKGMVADFRDEVDETVESIKDLNEIMAADIDLLKQASDAGLSFEDTLKLIRGQAELTSEGLQETGEDTKKIASDFSGIQKNLLGAVRGLIGFAAIGGVAFQITRQLKDSITELVNRGIELNQTYRAGEPAVRAYTQALKDQKRATDALAISTANQLLPIMTQWNKFWADFKGGLAAQQLVSSATAKELAAVGIQVKLIQGLGTLQYFDALTGETLEWVDILERLNAILPETGRSIQFLIRNWSEFEFRANRRFDSGALGARYWDEWGNAVEKNVEDAVEAAENLRDVFSRADLGIADSVANMLDTIAFLGAGGGELQVMAGLIRDAIIAGGTISEEDAREMFEQIFIEAQVLQVRLGNITAWDAAVNIRDQLGGSLDAARKIVDDILAGLDLISLTDVKIKISGIEGLEELSEALDPLQEKLFIRTIAKIELPEEDDPLLTMFQGLPEKLKPIIDEALPEIQRIDTEGISRWRDRLQEVIDKMGIIFNRADITVSFTSSGGTTP